MGKKLHEAPEAYAAARAELLLHCDGRLPTLFDPFAGGGSIPLESSRLGFSVQAGDLNPVAVLLNKCNLELAPRWVGQAPVNPTDGSPLGAGKSWRGTHGLAADVRYYSTVIQKRAQAEIGHLYPTIRLAKEHGGAEAPAIAWIWARTVASPNLAARSRHVPLISTYWLHNTKKGSSAWLEPIIDKAAGDYRFDVRLGAPKDRAATSAGTKRGRGARFQCLLTDTPIEESHIKTEAKAGRLGYRLLAIVVDAGRARRYIPATIEQQQASEVRAPEGAVDEALASDPRNIWCVGYGLERFNQLFTPRQLTAMVALSDLVKEIRADIESDARVHLPPAEASAYATTVATFLALAVDRCADFNNSLCGWSSTNQKVMHLFGRQAIPMVWDFAEANILGESVGGWRTCSDYVADCIETIVDNSNQAGEARQIDAATDMNGATNFLVSTDPPYYDNISYAGLSDFFYVWLRRALSLLHPDLFATVLGPKVQELTASPERFEGDTAKAKAHFEHGFRKAFVALKQKMDPRFPLTVYYAFKQNDEPATDRRKTHKALDRTTGWETMLGALISSGFQITATWPVRASQKWRMVSMGSNALASYIVLACRPRPKQRCPDPEHAVSSRAEAKPASGIT